MVLPDHTGLLVALIVVGALLLIAYAELLIAIFRADDISSRSRWAGLLIPGMAFLLAVQTRRFKRVALVVVLLIAYVALRVGSP